MKYLRRIHLVDKFLIVFMAIFMLQSAYNLFVNEAQTSESNTIDVIVRTSAAAIFGYFISANFVRRDSLKPLDQEEDDPREIHADPVSKTESTGVIKNRIGFSVPETESGTEIQKGKVTDHPRKNDEAEVAQSLQIVITAAVGITALCILLIFRDFFTMTAAAAGTVSQLRDFVSGCVGFLIGTTTRRES